ncbi:DENN domain-containing protein 10-like [Oscarella lobularis]|uniref:DENN domain-containing protein 10-like n=1 Tax=Oscarella lobularis TaxID=121494 RepID=UPI0033143C54
MAGTDLIAAGLIEKDENKDVLWTWSYPTIDSETMERLRRKCLLSSGDSAEGAEDAAIPFTFGHFSKTWHYIHTTKVDESEVLPKVTYFSVVLLTKDFNPEKYQTLMSILASAYASSGSAAKLLEPYLKVLTTGQCTGQFQVKSYDVRRAYIAASIKDFVNQFGVETILVYTALLLKKRVAVYHPRLPELLKITRALPVLVWQRQNWNVLYPHVDIDEAELNDLKSMSTYVAGFTDPAVESRAELYDVFVNVPGNSISIASHAKESFGMGKIHKDIAMQMVQQAADDSLSEQLFIKELAFKTKELVGNLKKMATVGDDGVAGITLESLQARKLTPAMENFLFNLASAEGLVQL